MMRRAIYTRESVTNYKREWVWNRAWWRSTDKIRVIQHTGWQELLRIRNTSRTTAPASAEAKGDLMLKNNGRVWFLVFQHRLTIAGRDPHRCSTFVKREAYFEVRKQNVDVAQGLKESK